jgi:hypothetical protein
MPRQWIDEGLQREPVREELQRRALEERHHETSVIKEKGPILMRELLAEARAAIDEYRSKARLNNKEIQFEGLPHEGFCVAKTMLPKTDLECRPDYEAHLLYCSMTRIDDHESDPVESLFSLTFAVGDSNNVRLARGTRTFLTVEEAVEHLLKPVLFPLLDRPGERGTLPTTARQS